MDWEPSQALWGGAVAGLGLVPAVSGALSAFLTSFLNSATGAIPGAPGPLQDPNITRSMVLGFVLGGTLGALSADQEPIVDALHGTNMGTLATVFLTVLQPD